MAIADTNIGGNSTVSIIDTESGGNLQWQKDIHCQGEFKSGNNRYRLGGVYCGNNRYNFRGTFTVAITDTE